MSPVRFGIQGCGQAASFHLSASRNNPDVQFVSVCAPDEAALLRLAKRNKLRPCSDLQEFLQTGIDAVLITTPHHLHPSLTQAAAEAGKHVLCEKPMANSLEECDQMIAGARKAGVKLMIAENHRFLPAHQFIRDAVASGAIGDVFLVRSYEGAYDNPKKILDPDAWMFSYDRGGGGALHDQGAHKFAVLNWLLGTVDSALCWCAKVLNSPPSKGEDTAMVLLRYKNGAMAEVTVSTATVHVPTNRLEVHGTKGTILEDHDWERPVKVYPCFRTSGFSQPFQSPELEHGPFPQYYTISFRNEVAHFAECILNDTPPAFTPEEAREAIAVTHLAYLAAKKRSVATLEELKELVRTKGTRSLFEGLDEATWKNYENLRW